MSAQELRDELMTMLVAGHETTASALAWAFERLGRHADVRRRLVREIDAGEGDAYLTATIQETLRRRPVLPNAAPRLVVREIEVGGRRYEPGVALVANAYLVHHDPAIYPDPYAFRPERFLERPPGTYTWIPFGGGRRRCLGASFATLEMKVVLRAVLARYELGPHGPERARRRNITIRPAAGSAIGLRSRERVMA
jgi:cytochrome P450